MAHIHKVRPGEHLSLIAKRAGFSDHRRIYDHPQNQALRAKRADPNLVRAGDEVFIPDLSQKELDCATDQSHKIVVTVPRKVLRMQVRDPNGILLKDEPIVLVVDGERIETRTDGDGFLEQRIRLDASSATLRVRRHQFQLQIGELDPIDTDDDGVAGVQMRLANLGYSAGTADGVMGPRTRAAIRAFQRHMRYPPTGQLDERTKAKLIERHGS